jgi:hypothetical protein
MPKMFVRPAFESKSSLKILGPSRAGSTLGEFRVITIRLQFYPGALLVARDS